MPANLTPQFHKAQQRFRAATEPREQLEALEEMLRVIPKHKGTEHLQADIKRRIKEARETARANKRRRGGQSHAIPHGEYPQICVIGAPNTGKSTLISRLTGVELEVAPYPYTTREARPVMMPFENARLQLVDTPPISVDHMEPWLSSLARAADAVLLVVDIAADDLLEATEGVITRLAGHKLHLASEEDAISQPTIIAANKCDEPDIHDALMLFGEMYGKSFDIFPISALHCDGVERLRRHLWTMLDLVRAVPKPPGKDPDYEDPILLPRGSTVVDMARAIHGELAEQLKRARVWGCRDHAEGQWVSREHVVEDGEIFELIT